LLVAVAVEALMQMQFLVLAVLVVVE